MKLKPLVCRQPAIPLVLVTLIAAGCANTAQITTETVTPTYNAQSRGLTANAIVPTEVRAFQGRGQELTGVPCEVSSPFYRAQVTTPARVALPSYAESTPSVTVSCEANGLTQTQQFAPFNHTVNQRTRNFGGGILTHLIVDATTNDEISEFRYNPLRVRFPE